ncbi:UNVERIFIED_CONTAM: hypothetical protein Sradi_3699900 [Sesamum radiatum]|uniref:PHD-type domain-containing protein n=1 Tax=Sesamum radiatum TaxID=300843 RepID=A0AAW2PXK9_SESRA
MTGGGRCQRRRKSMAGGRGTAEAKKFDSNCNSPNLNPQITEKPSGSPNITKLPPASAVEFDLYTQARKVLSFRSPFDSEDAQAPQAFVSGANTLPNGVSQLLTRHSDSRKRHKKLHSGSENKSSTPGRPRGSNFWAETEEYFRELTVEDIERLDRVSRVGYSSNEKWFLIPSLDNENNDRYGTFNRMLASACEKDISNFDNGVELNSNGKLKFNELMVQDDNGPRSMDIDGDVDPRSKIYLASERPSKKRKLLGRDAGLEKLLVARAVEGSDSVCHYCSFGDAGDPLNCLIKCASCGMEVHQRCYGVQEDVDSSWLCSWCKWKNVVDLSTETPCLLCPRQGGALKPVRKRGYGSENDGSKMEFAHLFCCQWMPEVYLENTRTMEPIMNMDELKDTRRKLICYLCKVKSGACLRCSNASFLVFKRKGTFRSYLGAFTTLDLVELHSILYVRGRRDTEWRYGENLDLMRSNYVLFALNIQKSSVKVAVKILEILPCQLIDLGKVNAKDVASEIGVSDSLNAILDDNHMVPELQCKLLRWLKNHAHIGNLQKTLKVKIRSLVAPKPVADAAEGVGTVSIEESSISDAVPIKSVPPRRRTKSSIRNVKDDKSFSFPDKTNDETAEAALDSCLLVREDPNGTLRESLADESKKILVDPEQHQDDLPKDSIRIEDELRALAQSLYEDDLYGETKQSRQMTNCSLMLTNGEVNHASYVHPFIYSKMMQSRSNMLDKTPFYQSGVPKDQEASQLEASSSSGLCCSNNSAQATSDGWTFGCNGVNLDQLVKATNLDMLKLSPADDVEGELIYYQTRLLCNAAARKRISVVRSLPQEIDAAGKQKWDAVLVSQYNHDLREAKKQGRKERRHKEAQAVLAAATAAAAASSRISSIRKDAVEESSQQEDRAKTNVSDRPGFYSQLNRRVKETLSRSATARSSFDTNSDSAQLASDFSKDHPRTCDVCRRSETVLNPILVCSSCKVAVHLDCYRSVKSTTGPWHCELCVKTYFLLEVLVLWQQILGRSLTLLQNVDCVAWVLESTYRRGQVNPIEGMDTVCRGVDTCTVCRRNRVFVLSYGHCQTTFHPTCARCAGFYMTVRTNGGKLHHKAYCEKHSIEQKAKADTHRHGIEEFKSLKQVRVSDHGLNWRDCVFYVKRIIKREKLKRELVLCSHDILASSRDSVLSALARHPFYQPEVSSESATTSIKGYTDG